MKRELKRYYRGFRLFMGILKSKILKRRIPIITSFHVTNRCNLRCSYCYANVDNRFDENLKDYTTEELKKYIDDLYTLGTRWFIILGGEPLMRKDIGEILEHLDKKNVLIEVVTNGYFAKKHIESLKLADFICVSLDGNEEDNDAIRGKGSYQKAIDAVKLLTENGITTRIHATISTANLNSIEDMEKIAMEYGIQYGYSTPILHDYNIKPDLFPDEDSLKNFYAKLRERKKTRYGSFCYNSLAVLDYINKWPLGARERIYDKEEFKKFRHFKFLICQMGRRYAYIDSDGTLYPCIVTGVTNGANIREFGVKEAWKRIKDIPCYACSWIEYVTINSLLTLHPRIVTQGFLYLLHGLFKRKANAR